jgi:hypothetical protein
MISREKDFPNIIQDVDVIFGLYTINQNTHHSFLVAVDHVDDALGVLVPEEDVAAIGSRDNKFTLWSVKIYTLD